MAAPPAEPSTRRLHLTHRQGPGAAWPALISFHCAKRHTGLSTGIQISSISPATLKSSAVLGLFKWLLRVPPCSVSMVSLSEIPDSLLPCPFFP